MPSKFDDVVDVVGGREAAGDVDVVVVPTQQVVGAEVEFLLGTVAGDLGWEHPPSVPLLVAVVPRLPESRSTP